MADTVGWWEIEGKEVTNKMARNSGDTTLNISTTGLRKEPAREGAFARTENRRKCYMGGIWARRYKDLTPQSQIGVLRSGITKMQGWEGRGGLHRPKGERVKGESQSYFMVEGLAVCGG